MKRFGILCSILFLLFLSACTEPIAPTITCKDGEILADSACVPFTGTGLNRNLFGQEVDTKVQTFDISEGDLRGFYVEPRDDKNYPGIIMIHEWWGLNDNIKYMAKLLASSGYKVFAIDLYGEVATNPDKAKELSGKVRENPKIALDKMEHAKNFLKFQEGVTKYGTIGWCFGGGQSLDISLSSPMDATVVYYGNLSEDTSKLSKLSGPVLGVFGDKDSVIPLEKIRLFEKNLKDLGKKHDIYVYPGLGHAFANPSGANYASGQTVDAWNKTINFLEKNLK